MTPKGSNDSNKNEFQKKPYKIILDTNRLDDLLDMRNSKKDFERSRMESLKKKESIKRKKKTKKFVQPVKRNIQIRVNDESMMTSQGMGSTKQETSNKKMIKHI